VEALTPASAQDGGASVRLHARAATDLGLLRTSRLNHVCTEEPIAEDEELALAVRPPAAEAERVCLTCCASGRPVRASAPSARRRCDACGHAALQAASHRGAACGG